MSRFNVKMAGKVIGVTSLHEQVMEYCRDYLTDEDPDFSFSITQEDIEYERDRSARDDESEGRPVHNYSDGYLEELAVYRKIAEKMPDFDTFLFHGSAIAVDGETYLFTAKSGTGKSTHTRLWRKYFGDRAVMVNDDKPLLRVGNSRTEVCGTPYCGKHNLGSNIILPLKAVCILTRAQENSIRKVSISEVRPLILQQSYRPADPLQLMKTLDLIDKMAENTAIYILGCNMDISAAEPAYNGMK